MNLYELTVGDKVGTQDEDVAEVVAANEEDDWMKVCYVQCREHPELVDSKDLCSEDEAIERISAA